MYRRRARSALRTLVASTAAFASVWGALGPPSASASPAATVRNSPTAQVASAASVRVAGNRLTRNGKAFVPRGLTLVGLLSPDLADPVGADAANHYGQAELTAAKTWNVNTIRFQISQRGMDPTDVLHTAAYDTRVKAAVHLARSNSMVVILSMQDQSIGGGDATPMPDASTVRAWQHLAPMFKADLSVLFELYNEPQVLDDPPGWTSWRSGGGSVVGHQHLVDVIRATGATNVLIADGVRYGRSLYGTPGLADSLKQLAYGVHPYLQPPIEVASAWDQHFGNFAGTHAVVATEWNAASVSNHCRAAWPANARLLVTYLRDKSIGLAGFWAFDIVGTAVTGWTWGPTNFKGFACGTNGDGAGQLVQNAFVAGW